MSGCPWNVILPKRCTFINGMFTKNPLKSRFVKWSFTEICLLKDSMLPSSRVSMECTVDGGLIAVCRRISWKLIHFDLLSKKPVFLGAFCWDFSFHSSECIHVYGYTYIQYMYIMAVAGTDIADAPQLESERFLKLKKDTQVQNKSQASKYHEISKKKGAL